MIYSTTYVTVGDGGHAGPQVRTQLYALVLGLLALLVCLAIDYRMLAEHSLILYAGLHRAAAVRPASKDPPSSARNGGSTWVRSTCSRPSSGA